jgi:hypothetical protein
VDAGVGHQVGLELGEIDVEGAVEAEGGSEGRHDLGDETVEVGVGGALNVKVAAAHVVEGLIIKAEGAVSVLKKRVGGEHVVVGLDDGGSDLGGGGHGEGKLGLAAVVDGKALEKERAKTGAGSTTSGVEDHEALKTSAVIGELADAVEDKVDNLLADGVVATGVVVGSILLAGDKLLGVVELAVGASADLVTDTRLKIDEDGTRDVLASTSLGKEGVEGVITTTDGLVGRHLAIRLDAVLKAVELPAGVTSLDTSLANVNRKTFSHFA